MQTLCYLAQQLSRPVSWFLEEDGAISANQQVMESAREAFHRGDVGQCWKLLQSYREPDNLLDSEYRLLRLLTLISLAEQAQKEEKKPLALELLTEAEEAGETCLYDTDGLRQRRLLLQMRLQPERISELNQKLSSLDEQLFLRAQAAREAGELVRCEALLNSMEQRDTPQWAVAMAEVYFARREYAAAAKWYTQAEEALPEQTLSRLEQCFNALEDYKLAYHYACKQRK